MKKRFSYKILTLAAIMALAFVLVSCSPSTEKSMEVKEVMTKPSEESSDSSSETAINEDDTMNDEKSDDTMTDEKKDETMSDDKADDTMSGEKVFTLEELKQYDGTNGNPAYVAVDGVVYDVTDKPLWAGGTHKGNLAGQDLSEAILKSPHGKAKLEELPVVGTLAEE